MFGLRDDDLQSDPNSDDVAGPVTRLFSVPFALPSRGEGYRGNAQPATAFTLGPGNIPLGRVFFIGTQFVPPGNDCSGHFDSILYALAAFSGGAAYNMPGSSDGSIAITDQRVNAVRVSGGKLVVDTGLISSAPPPPAPPAAPPPPSVSGIDVGIDQVRLSTSVCFDQQ
jgi:hypothetical protein